MHTSNVNTRHLAKNCGIFFHLFMLLMFTFRLTEDLVSTTSFKNTTADEEAATAFKAGAPHNQTYELMSTTSHGQVQEVIDEFRPVRQIKHAAGPATAHSSEFKMCAPTKHSISLTHTSEDLRDIEKARVTTTINRRELDRTFIEGQNLTGLQELEAKVASTSSYPRCSIPFCKAALLGPGPFTNVICYKHALCNECLDLTIDYLRLYGKISCAIMGCEVIVTEHTVATRPDLLSLVRRSRRPLQRNLNSKINPVRTDSALSAATLAEKRLQDLRRVRRYPNNKRLWSRMIYRTCDMCQRDSIWVEICILENCVHVICSICYYNRYTRRQPLARCPATYCTMAVLSQDGIEDSNKTNSYHSAFVNGSQTYPNGSALTAGFSTRTKTYRTADSDLPPKSCDLCKRLFASTLSEAFVVSRCYHGFCDYCASYKIYRLNSNVCPFPACRTKLSYDDFGRFCTFIERIHFEFARRTKGVER